MGEHNARFHSRAILGIAVVFVAAVGTVCLWAGPYHQKQLLEKAEDPSQQVRVASLEETGESGRSIDMEEKQGGMDQRSGGQRLQPSRGDKLPRCYFSPSSPDASPSEGAWRSCPNGVRDSPAYRDDWELPSRPFGFLKKCDMIWDLNNHPGPRPYWAWEPATCSLDSVDEAKFCRVMEGRKGLLLVGDSLTRHMTTTLASVLGAKAISLHKLQDQWQACEGQLRLRFVRNDHLDPITSPTDACKATSVRGGGGGGDDNDARCQNVATDDTLREFDTLVVNSGAMPRPALEYGRQMEAAAEALASAMYRLHGKDRAILVVRNTPPGHWGCTERMFGGPVNATVAEKAVGEAPEKYKWNTFQALNFRLEEAFSVSKGWRLLDAYTPTLLRADSHIGEKDCLHFCFPGPVDHWVNLLFNILLAETTE